MKNIVKLALATLLLFVAIAMTAQVQEYPKSTGYVNDFTRLLSQDQGNSLNSELAAFEKKTTIEIAVVIVSSLNGENIENYTRGLATLWGVGKRGQNNGIVFLIAPNERKMRIETASGIRSTLTDSRANEIRDEVVLPLFKAGNMPKGIIDGTHAIMHSLDATFSPTEEKVADSQPVKSHEWTPDDTKILGYVLGSIVGVIILLLLIVPPILRSQARNYVLENKASFLERMTEAEKLATNSDVKEETRKKLAKLKSDFSSISRLTATDRNVRWSEIRDKLDSFNYPINDISRTMKNEIAFAQKARKEGPELMKKIPGMIKAAEKKLAEGKRSPEAAKYLKEARSQYEQAQSQRSGMTVTDWVILYMILSSVQSNTSKAESSHAYANGDHSSSPSHSSDSSSSYGFGDSGGFNGGVGFDSGGGGSSGSW